MIKRAAVVSGIALLLLLSGCGNNRRFDATAWQNADARERGRMAESLVQSRMLIGKNADEAQRVLGKADVDYGNVLSYKINLGWLFKDPKHYGLQVHLDANREVTEVKIVD